MEKITQIKQYADQLRLTQLRNRAESIIHSAQIDKPTYLDYTCNILEQEVQQRQKTDFDKRLKLARLPRNHDLNNYDFKFSSSISKHQMQELKEFLWLEQAYNLILMGPSGTGKSYIAAGLVHEAINKGYRAYFTTMEALDDEVLATALLDRILYHCEVIKLEGNSYRMENRKNILSQKEINMD